MTPFDQDDIRFEHDDSDDATDRARAVLDLAEAFDLDPHDVLSAIAAMLAHQRAQFVRSVLDDLDDLPTVGGSQRPARGRLDPLYRWLKLD